METQRDPVRCSRHQHLLHPAASVAVLALLLSVTAASSEASEVSAADEPVEHVLTAGIAETHSVRRGDVHCYLLFLRPGEVAYVRAVPDGVDLNIHSGGLEAEPPVLGERAPVTLTVIPGIESPTAVQVRVMNMWGRRATGTYEISVEVRDATPRDLVLVDALRAYDLAMIPVHHGGDMTVFRDALTHLQRALELSRSIGDREGMAAAQFHIAQNLATMRDHGGALSAYEAALPLMVGLGRTWSVGVTQMFMGWMCEALGDHQKALEHHMQAMPILNLMVKEQGSPGHPAVLASIGQAHLALGNKEKALDYYRQSLAIAEQLPNRLTTAIALNGVGDVYAAMSAWDSAMSYYERALSQARFFSRQRSQAS